MINTWKCIYVYNKLASHVRLWKVNLKHANREKPRRGRVFWWSMEGKASEAIIVAINRRVHRGKSNGTENQSVLATAVSRKRSMKKDGMITLAFQWTANPETGGTGRVTSREEGLQGKKTRIERKKRSEKRKERGREWSRKSVGRRHRPLLSAIFVTPTTLTFAPFLFHLGFPLFPSCSTHGVFSSVCALCG